MSKLAVHSLANGKDSLKLVNYFAQKIIRGEISHCNHVFDYLMLSTLQYLLREMDRLTILKFLPHPVLVFSYMRIGCSSIFNSFPTSPLLRNNCKIP